MKSALLVAAVAFGLLVVPAFAQSDPSPNSPLDVQPAGLAEQPEDAGRAAIEAIQSPIAPGIPGLLTVEVGPYGAQASMYLDGQYRLYSYECGGQRCQGFATDLWRAVPGTQRKAYTDAVLDALMTTYPDLRFYKVDISGRDSKGDAGVIASDETQPSQYRPASGRTYRFVPSLD